MKENNQKYFSTEEFAEEVYVKPQSIRAALSRDGHYLGIKPIKLPNRRLCWDVEEVKNLFNKK